MTSIGTTDCTACPLRKRELFAPMTAEEAEFMLQFKKDEVWIEAGTPILSEGTDTAQLYTVLRGMGLRYKMLEDGGRQVTGFAMPGDFLGLQGGLMGEMGHSVEASTAMTLCVFDRNGLWDFFQAHPSRAFDLTWTAAVEENFLGEALMTVGRRSALSAVAWTLLRLFARGEALGLVIGGTDMPLPYRQQDIADALGLSLVHTNKTLRRLRDTQQASWVGGVLRITDRAALARTAQEEMDALCIRPLL